MSTTRSISCKHCGRTNFKTERGLQQHLRTSSGCSTKHQQELSANVDAREAASAATAKEITDTTRRATRSQTMAQLAENSHLALAHDYRQGASTFETKSNVMEEDVGDSEQGTHYGGEVDDFGPDDDDGEIDQEVDDADASAQQLDGDTDDDAPEDDAPGPSRRGLDDFVCFCTKTTFFAPLTDAEESGIKLLEVLKLKKSPMNAYGSVMEWHLREKGALLEHQTLKTVGPRHYIGRAALIDRLARRYNMSNKRPVEKTVRLPSSKEVVKIPVFDAEDCIVQLLANPWLEDSDFDFYNDDPLAPPDFDQDYIGDNSTGSAYLSTYQKLIKGPNEQLIGVIFYIDGATTGHFVDLPVTAVKLSLSIFTRQARLKEHMWAILGYLPQVKVSEGRGKKIFRESQHLEAEDVELLAGEGENIDVDGNISDESVDGLTDVKAQDFHFMLSVILESFVDPLISRGMLWNLVYKRKLYPEIHFKFFVSMVKGDTEEADTLCGKYKPCTRNIAHLCRQCHVPTMEADNHRANHPPKTQTQIQKMVRAGKLAKLKAISQQYIKNAWYKCRFNLANDRGIHGACPSEMLHAMLLGIFKYVRDIFFDYIGKDAAIAQDINGLAKIYGKLISRQSERSLPVTNFSKGIKEGKLMARDYRGVLLIMAAVLVSTSGRRMLSTKRKFKKASRKDDWILLVELLLEWEAFLCQPTMKKVHVARLDKKHRYIMYIMKKVAKRSKGMGLNIMKFHGIVHLVEDIQTNGVPLEFDTAANESHHKASKYAAQLTQRHESTFQTQVATRLWEFNILDYALAEIHNGYLPTHYLDVSSTDESMSESVTSGRSTSTVSADSGNRSLSNQQNTEITTDDAQILVYNDDDEGEVPAFKMLSKSKHVDKTTINTELLEFLLELQAKTLPYLAGDCLPIFTRHQRGDVIFHAHPNYRGLGPWKDWAVIDWGAGYGQLPCHLQAFVELTNMPSGRDTLDYGGVRLHDGVYAVVEESRLEESELGRSDLFVPFLKTVKGLDNDGVTGRTFFLADTEAIVQPCAMIPDIGGPPNRYFRVKARDEWVKEFVQWLLRPHHEDDMSDDNDDDN